MSSVVEVKVQCACGANYRFDTTPVHGQMPVPIQCPACGADGTPAANAFIHKNLPATSTPPPSPPPPSSSDPNRAASARPIPVAPVIYNNRTGQHRSPDASIKQIPISNKSSGEGGEILETILPQGAELQDQSTQQIERIRTKQSWPILATAGGVVIILLGYFALVKLIFPSDRSARHTSASLPPTVPTNSPLLPVPILPVANDSEDLIKMAPPTSSVVVSSGSTGTNAQSTAPTNQPSAAVAVVKTTPPAKALPPLPEDTPRTYRLKNNQTFEGVIVSVTSAGVVIRQAPDGANIKQTTAQYTPRLAWDLFGDESLVREPQVIAFHRAQEKAKEMAIQAKAAAVEAAEKQKMLKAERELALKKWRDQQDELLDASISQHGWEVVTKGYLQAWGSNVTIGDIFAKIAPSAIWSAGKLAEKEEERYTHYIVEAKWTNDNGERVSMQYLVTARGTTFHLHGCFVSGKRMADQPFLRTVKSIWDKK